MSSVVEGVCVRWGKRQMCNANREGKCKRQSKNSLEP